MLLKPVSFLKKAAAGVTWDVEDDFTSYTTGQSLAATTEWDDANSNGIAGTMEVQSDDTVVAIGSDYTARVVARGDTSLLDDMRAEIDVVAGPGAGRCSVNVGARNNGSGTGYELVFDTNATTSLLVRKWTATTTFSDIHTFTITNPGTAFTLAIEVTDNGANADIEAFLNTGSGWVSQGTYTDSSSPHTTGDHATIGFFNDRDSGGGSGVNGNSLAIAAFRARSI